MFTGMIFVSLRLALKSFSCNSNNGFETKHRDHLISISYQTFKAWFTFVSHALKKRC